MPSGIQSHTIDNGGEGAGNPLESLYFIGQSALTALDQAIQGAQKLETATTLLSESIQYLEDGVLEITNRHEMAIYGPQESASEEDSSAVPGIIPKQEEVIGMPDDGENALPSIYDAHRQAIGEGQPLTSIYTAQKKALTNIELARQFAVLKGHQSVEGIMIGVDIETARIYAEGLVKTQLARLKDGIDNERITDRAPTMRPANR